MKTDEKGFAKIALAFLLVVVLRHLIELGIYDIALSYLRFLEFLMFFAMIFLLLVLGISKLGNESPAKAAKFIMKFFWLIAVTPVIDHFVFGLQTPYYYGAEQNFLSNLLTFYLFHPGAGPAQIVAAFIITIASSVYIFRKTRNAQKSLFFFVCVSLFSAFVSTSPARFSFISSLFNSPGLLTNLSFFTYFSMIFVLWIFGGRKAWMIFKGMRPSRGIYFAVLALLPFFAYNGGSILALNSFIAVFLLWNSVAAINDITDIGIDRISSKKRILVSGKFGMQEYLLFAYILMASAFLLALISGLIPLLIALVTALLSVLYSAPPLRLRRFIWSNFLIGISAALSFAFGLYSITSAITANDLIFVILCFAVTSFAAFTKDLKDFMGDKKQKIKTLFTVFGIEKGKKLSVIFLMAALLLPSAFIPNHAPVFILISIIAAYVFHKKENVVPVIFLTLIDLLYSFAVLYSLL